MVSREGIFFLNTVMTTWPVPAVNKVETCQRMQQNQLINKGNSYYSTETNLKFILLTYFGLSTT